MSYAQIDDKILDCPKALEAGEDATDLFIRSVIWCNEQLTDGRIPKAGLSRLTGKAHRDTLAAALVRVGWWEDRGDAWHIVGFLEHNDSRETILERRAQNATRMQQARAAKRERASARAANVQAHTSRTCALTEGERAGSVRSSSPLHSSPLHREEEESADAPPAADAAPLALASPSTGPTLPELQALWNERLPHPPFPRWVELGPDQRKQAKRIRERALDGETGWIEILRRIGNSSFCRGSNDRAWVADPDFLLRVATPRKVLEGKYDDRTPMKPQAPNPYRLVTD